MEKPTGCQTEAGQERLNRSIAETNAMILFHRSAARKMALQLLKRWGARLEMEEAGSIADLAACEAARCFNPLRGASFITYLHFYLRGFLIRELSSRSRGEFLLVEEERGKATDSREMEMAEQEDWGFQCGSLPPDEAVYAGQVREACGRALECLSELERRIVLRVHVFDFKVAAVARQLGYSRGHVSELRRQAFMKMRPELEQVREAA